MADHITRCECCLRAHGTLIIVTPTDANEAGTILCDACATATSAGLAPLTVVIQDARMFRASLELGQLLMTEVGMSAREGAQRVQAIRETIAGELLRVQPDITAESMSAGVCAALNAISATLKL